MHRLKPRPRFRDLKGAGSAKLPGADKRVGLINRVEQYKFACLRKQCGIGQKSCCCGIKSATNCLASEQIGAYKIDGAPETCRSVKEPAPKCLHGVKRRRFSSESCSTVQTALRRNVSARTASAGGSAGRNRTNSLRARCFSTAAISEESAVTDLKCGAEKRRKRETPALHGRKMAILFFCRDSFPYKNFAIL